MRKIAVSKYFGSRQLRPENLKPLKAGLSRQLECLRVKQDSPEVSVSVDKAELFLKPLIPASKASSWIKEQ